MKKKKVTKLKLQKVKVSHLKGGAATQNADQAIPDRTWRCRGSVFCTYSCMGEYTCFCTDVRTIA